MKTKQNNSSSANSKVLMFGTFDILHPGHLKIFEDASKLGDELYVVVARDKTVLEVKGKETHYPENERVKHVNEVSHVTKAMLGNLKSKYEVLDEVKPDIIVLGYDQKFFIEKLAQEIEKRDLNTKIVRFSAHKPHVYKSSLIRERMHKKENLYK